MKITTVYIVNYFQLKDGVWGANVLVLDNVNDLAEFIVMLETNRDKYRLTSVNANVVPEAE